MSRKPRLDEVLVARGLAPDRQKAAAYVMAGEIIVGDHRADKAGMRIGPEVSIRRRTRKGHAYVSRGGIKLAGALDAFGIDPAGRVALDLGASTGGFTDCLLQRGAQRVYAVDVGYGLLDWSLQQDPRVVNLERTHAGELTATQVPEPIGLLVADISFNSLTRILPRPVELLAEGARAVLLVKPQFEAPPEAIADGGLVTDPAVRRAACDAVAAAVEGLGLRVIGVEPSSITGAKGNVEFLLAAQREG